jgi:hypothetical protein
LIDGELWVPWHHFLAVDLGLGHDKEGHTAGTPVPCWSGNGR